MWKNRGDSLDRRTFTGALEVPPSRRAPHNLEAEQALLGAILIYNEALDRVASFLDPHHFYDPLHQQIYETAAKLIHAGKQATPITLRTFFETAEPISPTLTVPQYLGTLAASATTIINAEDYGRTICDLATRRALILRLEDATAAAYGCAADASLSDQIDELSTGLEALRVSTPGSACTISRCLADIEARPISWFWPKRIALGKLSLLAGMPGLGKSQVTCSLVAAATTGGPLPGGDNAPLGSAIMITTEDEAADTIVPRMQAAGADLHRVHLLDWARGAGQKGKFEWQHFDVSTHGASLAELIQKIGDVRLIIIDPVTAHLGRADSHVTAEVRAALTPLQTLAASHGAAIILISHLNKNDAAASATNRVTGSNAFVAVCRSAWLIAEDRKDAAGERRIFAPIKNNIGDDKTAFAYRIEGAQIADGIATSRVAWESAGLRMTADELLDQSAPHSDAEKASALDEACEFLRQELADGPKPSKVVEKAAGDAGVKPGTLARARDKLKVKARRRGEGGSWVLVLPTTGQGNQGTQGEQDSGRE